MQNLTDDCGLGYGLLSSINVASRGPGLGVIRCFSKIMNTDENPPRKNLTCLKKTVVRQILFPVGS